MTAATLAAIAIAASTWGQPNCPQGVDIQWENLSGNTTAQAVLGGCEMTWDRREARNLRDHHWPMYCSVMVHEWGHLTGHDHSRDPDSVMYPTISKPYGGCK